MSKVIGIDLGSTLSEVAVLENNTPVIIVNEEGDRTTPSVIFLKNGERKVGKAAKRQAITQPKNTVNLIKRFMGGTYDEVKNNVSHVQYDVINENGTPRVSIEGKSYSPEELSSMIIQKMKKVAEDYVGETITDAVITVPALFSDAARTATKMAGELAGLNVLRIINEPTAAILASGIDVNKSGKYMVADYGGSTLDFSIADISDGVIEIIASYGDVYCGGSDLDKIIADYFVEEFKKDSGIDVSKDSMAMSRIIDEAEKAKIALSLNNTYDVNLPFITSNENGPLHFTISINKAKFESLVDAEINKVINCGKEALKCSKLNANDLNGILLVGGSTRIPILQDRLNKIFGVPLIKTANPDEAVALGAAVQGGIIKGDVNDILLVDTISVSVGIATLNDTFTKMIEANTSIPTKKTEVFSTAIDNQTDVAIVVLQGERPLASKNKQIGVFHLDGIAPAPRGVPQIEVIFDIDSNGILNVSAKDKATNKEQHITIDNASKLSDEEVERIKKEAEEFADADKKAKEEADKLNLADTLIFQTEKAMENFGDKISEDEKKDVTEKIEALKKAVADKNFIDIEDKTKLLNDAWNPIVTRIYQSSNPNNESSGFDASSFTNGQTK